MDDLEIITTSDGSHTLFNKRLNETYHSIHGAVQESLHVFIKNGVEYYCETYQPKNISILEVGFGTGLNALLTLQYVLGHNLGVRYTALEPSPLPEKIWSELNYPERDQSKTYFRMVHEAPWETETILTPQFSLYKINNSLQEVELTDSCDLVYYDAFAPTKQPEMWELPVLKKVTDYMKPRGMLVTYCAKGQLKRDLKSLGLKVETLPGPPGKNEMVRATKF